jgi:hypothetical protein
VDGTIIGTGALGYVYIKPMLEDPRAHPFYNSPVFTKWAPKRFGPNFDFDHCKYDADVLVQQISAKYPKAGAKLHCLLHEGGHLSWSACDHVIYQYYIATLDKDHQHLLSVVHNSGLALRQLLKDQSAVVSIENAQLATMNASKRIRDIRYNPRVGVMWYFSNLQSEIGTLEGVGMKMDEFSTTDLCGHILEMFEKADGQFAAQVRTMRTEASYNRFVMNLPNIRAELIKVEKANPHLKNRARAPAGVHAAAPRGTGPVPSRSDFTKDIIHRAVEYATRRFWMRNKGKPKPSCFTCRGTKPPAGHDTASCPITLLRCRNGAVDEATICGTHPDGVHAGSACKGGKKRTEGGRKYVNRDPRKLAAAQLAAARKLVADTDGPAADALKQKHMHAFLAIPQEQREALLSFMQS